MRIKNENKFDAIPVPSDSIKDFEITSASTLKTFVNLAKNLFMQTDQGELAYFQVLDKYTDIIQKQQRLFEQQGQKESVGYLKELDDILKEAKADVTQAVIYKYHPILLFNNWEGVDDEFKKFVIKYVVKHYSKKIQAINSEDILVDYSRLHGNNFRLTDQQNNNRLDFIGIVYDAFGEIGKKILSKAAGGLMNFNELCRILYPVVNKLGNKEWDNKLGRELWSKESKNSLNSVKPEDSLFIEKVTKRKKD